MSNVWHKNSDEEIFCLRHAIKEIIKNDTDITSFVDNLDYFYTCKKCLEESENEK